MSNQSFPRVLHTMLRISDISRSIIFYTKILGMKILRTLEQPTEKYTLIFLGYGDESNQTVIELTYNYGISSYELGNGYGHIAIGVENIDQTINHIKKLDYPIDLEPSHLKNSNEIIAFISDPDGYKIELIEHKVI
ncbi:lactoylglutathione lyase [Thalassotalea insulae]|uniref:Lactoylglutathione lyase n=1 Tax=Thalassotalea insulae TaxID=2056778 RepID=A0ABQ6H159_9GAMM|nr:lactoylglutathione lyase [Thalassotalea insulae]GLX80500.1 lactoylglutathione lyase [Thalassotalea insulae]